MISLDTDAIKHLFLYISVNKLRLAEVFFNKFFEILGN